MTEIISVRFKSGGRQYYFDPAGLTVEPNQGVIVETSRGLEYGECVQGNRMVEDSDVILPLRPVIRIATEHDLDIVKKNHEREEQAFTICQEKIVEHELEMKLVSVEQNFEGNKLLFFFTADNRVDFRALVKDLAATFHTRIELRQIGVRDEAKLLGGLGICGKPFCCSSFLGDFQPVSIKMAKTQNLSLNPTKISGTCGRLMCCLKYEQDAYEDAVRRCPKQDSFVETPDGVGTVCGVNLLREQVKVHIENSDDPPKAYLNKEIKIIRSGKGKRPDDYVVPSKEELEKLRHIPDVSEAPAEDRVSMGVSSFLSSMLQSKTGELAENNEREKNGGINQRQNGENRRTGNIMKKSGGDHQRGDSEPRKGSGYGKQSSLDEKRPGMSGTKEPIQHRKGKLKAEKRKSSGESRQENENLDKRSSDKRKEEKRNHPNPALQVQKSGDRKPYRKNYRHSNRNKPRGGGEEAGGNSSNQK